MCQSPLTTVSAEPARTPVLVASGYPHADGWGMHPRAGGDTVRLALGDTVGDPVGNADGLGGVLGALVAGANALLQTRRNSRVSASTGRGSACRAIQALYTTAWSSSGVAEVGVRAPVPATVTTRAPA